MLGGGADGDPLGARTALLGGTPLKLRPVAAGMGGTSGGCGGGEEALHRRRRGKEERVSQWSQQETGDLITIRAKVEGNLMVAPQNNTMWGAVAARMKECGYIRTPEQCKFKWKSLVSHYKSKEIAGLEIGRQCPSSEDPNAVLEERDESMARLLHESESGIPKSNKKLKRLAGDTHSVEFINEEEYENYIAEGDGDELVPERRIKKAESRANHRQRAKAGGSTEELLWELLHQHRRMEAQWAEIVERREQERRAMEQEWRRAMEDMERERRERRELERAWREREEERRKREENRAEKREALLTALLDKLINDAGDV